jgi:hypothetical protein
VGEIHINKGRVGEERGGKETDGCPLTPLLKNDGSNFQTWKHCTELVLLSHGLMPIVNSTKTEPAATDTNAVKEWKIHELDVHVQIQLMLEEEQLTGGMSTKDAKETRNHILRRLQGDVRGHTSISLPPLSSPTLPLFICISPTPLYHLQGPHSKPTTFIFKVQQLSAPSSTHTSAALDEPRMHWDTST